MPGIACHMSGCLGLAVVSLFTDLRAMWMDLVNVCTPVHGDSNDVYMRPGISSSHLYRNTQTPTVCLLKVKLSVETSKSVRDANRPQDYTCKHTHTHTFTHTLTVTKCQVPFQQFGSRFKNSGADLTSTLWSMPKWQVSNKASAGSE